MDFVLIEKEKAKKIDRLLERYGRIQRRRAWHKRSRTGGRESKLRFGGLKHEFTLPILRNQGKCKDQNGVRSITTY